MTNMLCFQEPKTSQKWKNSFHGQSCAKYVGNLLGFTENLDLK